MISQLVKITAILIALGSALPALAFGDDIGLSFLPENKQRVRVDAQTVEDVGNGVLVEPKDRPNNAKLSGLIKSLRETKNKQIKGTFRFKGKKLYRVVYIFDEVRQALKVRVDNVNYIISELRFFEVED